MVELLGEIRACKKLATAAEWNDANKVEGVLQRAPEELLAVLKQYKVPIDQLERKAAEAFNAAGMAPDSQLTAR